MLVSTRLLAAGLAGVVLAGGAPKQLPPVAGPILVGTLNGR